MRLRLLRFVSSALLEGVIENFFRMCLRVLEYDVEISVRTIVHMHPCMY